MDDDLLVPPRDAPVGELVTVKGHPPTPSRNTSAVSMIWDKVLNEELLQVGDDEVSCSAHFAIKREFLWFCPTPNT